MSVTWAQFFFTASRVTESDKFFRKLKPLDRTRWPVELIREIRSIFFAFFTRYAQIMGRKLTFRGPPYSWFDNGPSLLTIFVAKPRDNWRDQFWFQFLEKIWKHEAESQRRNILNSIWSANWKSLWLGKHERKFYRREIFAQTGIVNIDIPYNYSISRISKNSSKSLVFFLFLAKCSFFEKLKFSIIFIQDRILYLIFFRDVLELRDVWRESLIFFNENWPEGSGSDWPSVSKELTNSTNTIISWINEELVGKNNKFWKITKFSIFFLFIFAAR